MDIDSFIAANRPRWDRLDRLTVAGERGQLSAQQVDDLVADYEAASTHLSLARSRFADRPLTAELTRRVGRARALIYGAPSGSWRDAGRFVTHAFPAAVWRARYAIAAAALLFLVPAVAMAGWLGTSSRALDVAVDPAVREAYVQQDFADYYTAQPSVQFASLVTTNNIRVAVLAFGGGVLLCAPTILVMVNNGAAVGAAAGAFAAVDELPRFFGLILPHGLLELTAVFVAGGAGLMLGWALIDPGDRPRGEALAEEGRSAVAILIGLVAAFVVAGVIEGFVTGSALPTWARVGIGVAAETAFVGYLLLRGPVAAREIDPTSSVSPVVE